MITDGKEEQSPPQHCERAKDDADVSSNTVLHSTDRLAVDMAYKSKTVLMQFIR